MAGALRAGGAKRKSKPNDTPQTEPEQQRAAAELLLAGGHEEDEQQHATDMAQKRQRVHEQHAEDAREQLEQQAAAWAAAHPDQGKPEMEAALQEREQEMRKGTGHGQGQGHRKSVASILAKQFEAQGAQLKEMKQLQAQRDAWHAEEAARRAECEKERLAQGRALLQLMRRDVEVREREEAGKAAREERELEALRLKARILELENEKLRWAGQPNHAHTE